MEITHENLEKILKIFLDRMKVQLCLNFHSSAYSIQLLDHLKSDFILTKGDTVSIKVSTSRFATAIEKDVLGELMNPKENYEFKRTLEKCLRLVPRMIDTLANPAISDALAFNTDSGKFKKLTKQQLEQQGYEHKFEKEISYTLDYRATAIHFRSGTIIRQHSATQEGAISKARSQMVLLLQDPEVYKQDNDSWSRIEPHEDIIYDIVLESKTLTADEIETLINKLKEEYLK